MKSILLLFISLLLASLPIAAADLKIKFRVQDEFGNKLKGCQVQLYCGNEKVVSIQDASASNKLLLTSDKHYTLEVRKEFFVVKRIAINTAVEQELLKNMKYAFDVVLELASKYEQVDNYDDVLDYPIVQIEYDSELGEFTYNSTYYESTAAHLEQLRMQLNAARTEVAAVSNE